MSLPSNYLWTYSLVSGGQINSLYRVLVYSLDGVILIDSNSLISSSNPDIKSLLSNVHDLEISFYRTSISNNDFSNSGNYGFTRLNEHFYNGSYIDKNYFSNKVYNGINLGAYLGTDIINLKTLSGGTYFAFIFSYENGFVYVYDRIEHLEFSYVLPNGKTIFNNDVKLASDIFTFKKDNRIETTCCLQALCEPTKYIYIGA